MILWYDISKEKGTRGRMGERRGVYRDFVGKTEGKETVWETQA